MNNGKTKAMIVNHIENCPWITGTAFLPIEVEVEGFMQENNPGWYTGKSGLTRIEDETLFRVSASELERIGGRCYDGGKLLSVYTGDIVLSSKWVSPFAYWNKIKASREVGAV